MTQPLAPVCTWQFRTALQYLLCDPATAAFRVDAVHVAIALCHHKALHTEPEGLPELASFSAPQRIAQYGEVRPPYIYRFRLGLA